MLFKFSEKISFHQVPLVGTLRIRKGKEVVVTVPQSLSDAFTKIIADKFRLTNVKSPGIIAISESELKKIGGPENFRECGQSVTFHISSLNRWKDPKKGRYIWFFTVISKDLSLLRKTYSLPPSPHSRILPQFILIVAEEFPRRKYAENRGPEPGEEAVGIPDKDEFGDWSKLPIGEAITYVLHEHGADRAGKHFDLRFGTKEHGLLSWAVRKGLPKPGEKHLAVLQPLHSYDYKDFEGEITEGYGKGKVRISDQGHVIITDVSKDKIEFILAHKRHPERFVLVKTKDDKNWLLINTTPQKPLPFGKKNSKSGR